MKKIVAVLLSASVILSCAACTKETEETKKKKKKKKKETTIEDTVDTEDPETTEVYVDPTDPPEPVKTEMEYDCTLDIVSISKKRDNRCYGVRNESGYNGIADVMLFVDHLCLDSDLAWLINTGYDNLRVRFDDIYSEIYTRYNAEYEKDLEQLLEDEQNGTLTDEYGYYRCASEIIRSDTLYTCLVIKDNLGNETGEYTYRCYNCESLTGRDISFDEVVIDRDALIQYLADSDYDQWVINEVIEELKSGEEVPFNLTYDGIYIYWSYTRLKISAVNTTGIFDMKYFGTTPVFYVIESDFENNIAWDVTNDGITDDIEVEFEGDWYEFGSLTFTINGVTTTITQDDVSELEGNLEEYYLAYTDEGFCFIVTTMIEDDYEIENVFRLNDDLTVEYVNAVGGWFSALPYYPAEMQITSGSWLVGSSYGRNYYTLMGTGRHLERESSMYSRDGNVLVAKKDLTAFHVGSNSEITIPQDTALHVIAYDEEANYVYFELLYADDSQNLVVYIPYTEEDWDYKIMGEDESELFDGLLYGG